MRLTVLGSSGTFTSAGSVCSGYLVQTEGSTILVDAGNGSTANLHRLIDIAELDAVIISHEHADHCVDLIGLHHAMRARGDAARGIRLYSHPSVGRLMAELTSREAPYVFEDTFDLHYVQAGDQFSVGDVRVRLFDSIHPVPTLSMRLECDGRVLAYSADSAGGEELVEVARDADLFLCEATWQGEPLDHPDGIHLTALEAGRVASKAGVRRLMLTHIAGNLDREVSRGEASTTFDGDVELAVDLLVTDV